MTVKLVNIGKKLFKCGFLGLSVFRDARIFIGTSISFSFFCKENVAGYVATDCSCLLSSDDTV